MKFWLGTHEVHWLREYPVEFFISDVRLRKRKTYPKAKAAWCLDSGGFSELSLRGKWSTGPEEYVERVARYQAEIGKLVWAAPQDWMCEPFIIEKTGLSVQAHQEKTVENFLELDGRGPFIPVLQGWAPDDYYRHVRMYEEAGVQLDMRRVVGIGSVCRRGGTREAERTIRVLTGAGIKLHGFGLKITALRAIGHMLESADSMAWSYAARMKEPLPGHTHTACNNCAEWAFRWRAQVLHTIRENQRDRKRVSNG